MLYLIFGFFGASIGAATGFGVGLLGTMFFYRWTDPARLADGQWGDMLLINIPLGTLVGSALGAGIGLLIAHKISRKN